MVEDDPDVEEAQISDEECIAGTVDAIRHIQEALDIVGSTDPKVVEYLKGALSRLK